jgi:hypothetical protein
MVQEALHAAGFGTLVFAGNIFTPKNLWKKTGNVIRNSNPSARGRAVTLWEYVGDGAPTIGTIPTGTKPAAPGTGFAAVPGLNVGAAEVTSVAVHTPVVINVQPSIQPSTRHNTYVGDTVQIKPELQAKLTRNGLRPSTAKVVEIFGPRPGSRWHLRVEFGPGQNGLLDFTEVNVVK